MRGCTSWRSTTGGSVRPAVTTVIIDYGSGNLRSAGKAFERAELVAQRLEAAGLRVRRLPRSGLVAEVGESGPVVGLRGDLGVVTDPRRRAEADGEQRE